MPLGLVAVIAGPTCLSSWKDVSIFCLRTPCYQGTAQIRCRSNCANSTITSMSGSGVPRRLRFSLTETDAVVAKGTAFVGASCSCHVHRVRQRHHQRSICLPLHHSLWPASLNHGSAQKEIHPCVVRDGTAGGDGWREGEVKMGRTRSKPVWKKNADPHARRHRRMSYGHGTPSHEQTRC